MDAWFPRISPNGKAIISGASNLYLNYAPLRSSAIAGAWLNNEELLYRDHTTGDLYKLHLPTETTTFIDSATSWVEACNNRFVYQTSRNGVPEIVTWDNRRFPGFGGAVRSCSINEDGIVVMGDNKDGYMHILRPQDTVPLRVSLLPGANPFISKYAIFWENKARILTRPLGSQSESTISFGYDEFWPIVKGDWLMTFTQSRLTVRRLGTSMGFVVHEGVTFYPDFVATKDVLYFAWTSATNTLERKEIVLSGTPLVDVREPQEVASPVGTLIPKPSEFFSPRFSRTNSHPLAGHYDASTKTTTYVKFDTPDAIEQIREEPDGFHLIYDNTDGRHKPWRLKPNFWLPKDAKVGDTFSYPNAVLIRASKDGIFSDSHPFPYQIHVRSLTNNVRTAMGLVEVLTLEFVLTSRYKERFHYARNFGWFLWEKIENGTYAEIAKFDIPHTIITYPNSPTPIPDPPKPPPPEEPKPPMGQYKDSDYSDLAQFLDEKYKQDLNRSVVETFVDSIGRGRWTHDYIRERDKGASHSSALQTVNRRINTIVGLPEDQSPRPFPKYKSPMVGKLEFYKGWLDGRGYYTPIVCHFGEGFSLWTREPEVCKQALSDIAEAGYDGVRVWITLNVGSNPISYWKGREVGPLTTPDYYRKLEEFILYCFNTHNLRVHLACGDLSGFSNEQETELFTRLGDVLSRVPDDAILLVEGLNEARDTGDRDDIEPKEIERLINIIRKRFPQHLYALSAYTGTEEREDLLKWTPDWMPFVLVHGYRGGKVHDKVRHIFSLVYENPVRKWAWQGEPTGPGEWVSATENQAELDDDALAMMACMALMTGQVWCYMSSPGVKYTQSFKEMPGFSTVPLVRSMLPSDISTFTDRFHGGSSFSFKRLFAVPGTDETRADHVMHSDGRFAVLLYGPRWRECKQVKDCEIYQEIQFGAWGKLILGKVS